MLNSFLFLQFYLSTICPTATVSRLTGASKDTVVKLMVDAGKAYMAYHDATVRGVNSKRIQCDEIWSFTYAKAKNVAFAKAAPEGAGDTWTWTALDADSKLIVSYFIEVGMVNAPCGSWTILSPA